MYTVILREVFLTRMMASGFTSPLAMAILIKTLLHKMSHR